MKRILHIDDDPTILRSIGRALHTYEITSCSSNSDAIAALESGRKFDLIIQDLFRPRGSELSVGSAKRTGYDFHVSHLSRLAPLTPIIYLSAILTVEDSEIARLPATYLLCKPAGVSELRELIERILSDSIEDLYLGPEEAIENSRPHIVDLRAEIIAYFSKYPERIHSLEAREFERLVADILDYMGFDVQLTKASRDGGLDIFAHLRSQIGSFLILVECKKYHPERGVGIGVIQRLYGVQQDLNANKSMVVTSSFFTKPAKQQAAKYQSLMDLHAYEDLKNWLQACHDDHKQ